MGLLACLSTLNRMDVLLFYGPALIYLITKCRSWKNFGRLLLTFLPFVLWEVFSVIYYGFLFPNTAYAKLYTHIPESALLKQGLLYVYDSFMIRSP